MSAKSVEIIPVSGTEVLIPLNKLKKSSNNARKTPHSEAAIEGYAASIAAKGILQNLVVEPELDGEGTVTGFYLVTIGEGRRLAQLLRVKRKEIKKTEPIRCIIDTANDPHEISLDENVTRENMHPADQFEAFRRLAEERGFGAEEIAARFGVTPQVVRQRLRLGAVSPKLMQLYRDGDLTLEQLMAFAITDDQARQESVYERLSYDGDASTIRRLLTETHVAATDRRALFVGLEAYIEAGGTILRDLFTGDRGGYLEDVALLDLLVTARLGREADALRSAEGWKWTEPHLDFPHAHGMRRAYPHPVELSAEDQTALRVSQTEFDQLTEQHQAAEELPDEVDARFGELESQIEQFEAKRQAYDPSDVARGGAFVILNHDGSVRIERGFIRPEDDEPHAEAGQEGDGQTPDEASGGGDQATCDGEGGEEENEEEEEEQRLSDTLVRDLTAHRTLGLRLNLSEQSDVAIMAVTHALAAQIFYIGANAHVVGIQPVKTDLATHAVGIEDTPAGKAWSDRHANWRCGPCGCGPIAPRAKDRHRGCDGRGPNNRQTEMTMAIIGTFTASDNGYTGSIKTLTLNIKAKFVTSERDNDKAPDYRIFAGATEFGAAWKKTVRDSDREYLSVKLDDPSFPAPIYASLVKVEGDEGFTLIWSRRSGD